MKMKGILIGIIFFIIILGLSGCTDNETMDDGTSDNEQFEINRFEISPTRIEEGENAVLTWDVSNADSVAIDNGIGVVGLKGSMIVSPTEDTTYKLTAIKDIMTMYATASIEVASVYHGGENAAVAGEGTATQIKLVLASGGDDYGDGYNIVNDVRIFINGDKVSKYYSTIWKVGGQILLGLNGVNWEEGYTCPEGDYEVSVSIKDTVVFDGTLTVG